MDAAPQDPPVDDTKQPSDEQMNDSSAPPAATATGGGEDEGAINESSNNNNNNDDGLGSGIPPIFLGNLSHGVLSSDVENLFRNPVSRESQYSSEEKEEGMASEIAPFDLERVVSLVHVMCIYFCREVYCISCLTNIYPELINSC